MARLLGADEPRVEEEQRPGQDDRETDSEGIGEADPPGSAVRQRTLVGVRAAPMTIESPQPTMATTIAPRKAAPKPSTWKPSVS